MVGFEIQPRLAGQHSGSDTEFAIRDHCKGVNETFTPSAGGSQAMKIIPERDAYRLDDDEKQNLQDVGFGPRGVTIINESGLYSVILRLSAGSRLKRNPLRLPAKCPANLHQRKSPVARAFLLQLPCNLEPAQHF